MLAMFVQNVDLSDNDKARAKEAHVALFDGDDLAYYQGLVGRSGLQLDTSSWHIATGGNHRGSRAQCSSR